MARRNGTGTIKPCVTCGRLIRPKGWPAAKHPGTITHAGNGMCSTCLNNLRRERVKEEQRDRGPYVPDVETNRRNLNNFLQRIHADRQRLEQRKKIRMVIR